LAIFVWNLEYEILKEYENKFEFPDYADTHTGAVLPPRKRLRAIGSDAL